MIKSAVVILAGLFFFVPGRILAKEDAWHKIAFDGTHMLALIGDPARASTLYAVTSAGLMKSVDNGVAWTSLDRGLPADVYPGTAAVSEYNSRELYLGYDGAGIFKSVDGGETWQAVNDGLPNLSVRCIVISPKDPNLVYAGILGGVAISTSGGKYWHMSSGFRRSINVNAIVINPRNPQYLYAGTGGAGVFKSGNGGVSWKDVNEGLRSLSITSLHLDAENPDLVLAGSYHPASPTDVYVGDVNGGVSRSLDGGRSWQETSLSNIHIFSFAAPPDYPGAVYAGAWGGVYRSADKGQSWTDINAGLDNAFPHTLYIRPGANPPVILAGTTFGLLSYTDTGLERALEAARPKGTGFLYVPVGAALAVGLLSLLWVLRRRKRNMSHDKKPVW